MIHRRRAAVLGVVAAAMLGVFFFAPVLPYSVPVAGHYFPYNKGYSLCQTLYPISPRSNSTELALLSACLSSYRYPTYNLTGQSSLSYGLLGVGEPAFGSKVVLTLHNTTVILYFSGANLNSVESRLPEGTLVDPAGVVQVQNVTATLDYLGLLDLNVTVKNTGDLQISEMSVWMSTPPVYGIPTLPQRTEVSAYSVCVEDLEPGSSCRVSMGTVPLQLPPSAYTEVSYALEVKGYYGGTYFVYHATVATKASFKPFPSSLSEDWVFQFIQNVTSARGVARLSENATLDQFAALRFRTMVLNYNVSHYGYANDYYQFFHSAIPNGTELYLFPVGSAPSEFATYLQSKAPGHWQALMDTSFTQYGWYYSRGAEVVGQGNCNVTEIPGPNINVPQYFEAQGCSIQVLQEGWLVIELSGT